MKLRTLRSGGFNYDRDSVSVLTGLDCDRFENPTKTIQSAKDECDIRVIVKRFGLTGQFTPPARLPQYGDYSTISDFHTAMNVIREAEEAFMELPSGVRTRFSNDPQMFLDFCSDPSNMDELRKMGLAKPKEDSVESHMARSVSDTELQDGTRPKVNVAKRDSRDAKASRRSVEDSGGDDGDS